MNFNDINNYSDNNDDGDNWVKAFDSVFVVFSPYIIPIFFTIVGLYSGSLTGVIYLVSLLISIGLRQIIYGAFYNDKDLHFYSESEVCTTLLIYGLVDELVLPPFVSLWIFFYTMGYIIWPIFISIATAFKNNKKGIATGNIFFLIIFILYLYRNFMYLRNNKCITNVDNNNDNGYAIHLIINTCLSFLISSIFVLSMMSGSQSAKELIFFYDVYNVAKTKKNGCNRVTSTKFRCSA